MIEAVPIPGAPAPELLAAYSDLLVLRARLLVSVAITAGEGMAPAFRAVDRRLAELRERCHFPFELIAGALALSPLEREAVALAAARHLDPGLGDDIRRYRGDRPYVDGALVRSLVAAAGLAGADAPLEPRRALCEAGLIDVVAPRLDHVPAPLELELVPTPRLLGILRGEMVLDPKLRQVASLEPARKGGATGILPAADWARWNELFRAAARNGSPTHVLLTGSPGVGKSEVASALAAEAGFSFVLIIGGILLPRDPRELAQALEQVAAEARMLHALPVVRDVPVDRERLVGLREALLRLDSPMILTASDDDAPPLRQVAPLHLSLRPPDAELRLQAWTAELRGQAAELTGDEIRELAQFFPLARPDVARAVKLGTAFAEGEPLTATVLNETARVHLRSALARYGERVRSPVGLVDLVLPEELNEQIHEIMLAVRNRPAVLARLGAQGKAHRRGIAALFDGPPGTGKTLAATVIANELSLPLYRIDVSRIVDRYIGETEKNLAQLFEEAASDHAALLFDEADALFSRRVEVKDATDRYSNMQVGLLLTLIEEYEGLAIMTTNLKAGMDTALMRRIAYKLRFEAPRPPERLALWRRHLASIALAPEIDLDTFAEKYELSGGEIYNAVLRALLRAGPTGTIGPDLLRRAVRHELESRGNLVLH